MAGSRNPKSGKKMKTVNKLETEELKDQKDVELSQSEFKKINKKRDKTPNQDNYIGGN